VTAWSKRYENPDLCRLLDGWIFPCMQSGYCSSYVAQRKLFPKLQWLRRQRQFHRHYLQLPQGKWHDWQHLNQFCDMHRAIGDKQ
jgi:hypothetical protein